MQKPVSTDNLVLLARNGCEVSNAKLYYHFRPFIKGLVQKKLFYVRGWEAENITHDILCKILLKLKTFDETRDLLCWVYCLALNHCTDILRQNHSKKETSLEKAHYQLSDSSECNIGKTFEKLILEDSFQVLQKTLEFLPESKRSLLMDKYYYGFKLKEICLKYGLTNNNCSAKILRAKSTLFQILKECSLDRKDFI